MNKNFFNIFGIHGDFWELKGQVKTYVQKILELDGLLIRSQEIDKLLLIKFSVEDKLDFLETNGIKKSLKKSVITMN